ncbi:protein-tyrosine phosphatase-like protein [Pavlovales sp. CCMP2436]|nr:protein-tyrosine phosphatase-like protein [Pavlovales sp. CCMP2436]|mmetsp:Transcript_5053/g.13093  ORF Transcript_5053/g.13093 Transcript_5053/m.13093 type:complete len:196 (+) Transcript_5053:98-685(+)
MPNMYSVSPMREPDRHTSNELKWASRVDQIVNRGFDPKPLPCEMAPDLLLGGFTEAQDVQLLQRLGVTHVLNMACGVAQTGPSFYGGSLQYREVDADDDASYCLLEHFDVAYAFLRECRVAGGRMFIHCMAGINRSGAMALAFLIADGMDLLSAARHGLRVRGPICWNKGFQLELAGFARERGMLREPEAGDDES